MLVATLACSTGVTDNNIENGSQSNRLNRFNGGCKLSVDHRQHLIKVLKIQTFSQMQDFSIILFSK